MRRPCFLQNLSCALTLSFETPITVVPAAVELGDARREVLRFERAAGRVILGVEVEHDLAGAQGRQGDGRRRRRAAG